MNKKVIAAFFLNIVLILLTTTLVYANAKSYHGLTTIGYGTANVHIGGSYWDAYRIEYTTQPYYSMDQIGASFWSSYNTCDGVTNWSSYQGYSYPWYISHNTRSSSDFLVLADFACSDPAATVGRVSSVNHWWQSSGFSADGEVIPKASVVATTFLDVPPTYWAYYFIEPMYQIGIMDPAAIQHRCTTSNFFCPDYSVLRDEMAFFLERGIHGSNFQFPTYGSGVFQDVPTNYWDASVIEQLYADGITGGCTTNPLNFCPGNRVTRAEMAVFLLRAEHGRGYTPPPVSYTSFSDVPGNYWAAARIQQLYNEGITGGCLTNPLRYCPESWTLRAEMAVFLNRTFAP